jgi:hypothetical protein
MLQIVVLVCSAALSPADCQPETALSVISAHETSSPIACGMQAQALMARTTLGGKAPSEYLKIRCEPLRPARIAGKL